MLHASFGAVGALFGGIVGGVIAAATGGDFWTGAAIGAVTGGVIGLTCGAAASYVATGGATIFASSSTVMGVGGAAGATTAAGGASLTVPYFVQNAGSFISWLQQAFQNTKEAINLTQVKQLFDMAKQYGVKISADLSDLAGHTKDWTNAHIHFGNQRVHVAVLQEAIEWIKQQLGL